MNLTDAYLIIRESDPDAVLHIDHVCSEPIAHDSAHCALPASEQYTTEDVAADSEDSLRKRASG